LKGDHLLLTANFWLNIKQRGTEVAK
jgi:hypothetical protein